MFCSWSLALSNDITMFNVSSVVTFEKTLVFQRGDLRGVVANMLDCDIPGSEFKLQSHYYIHFWTNTLGKDMNLTFPTPHQLYMK